MAETLFAADTISTANASSSGSIKIAAGNELAIPHATKSKSMKNK
jgi:hypothetical protein